MTGRLRRLGLAAAAVIAGLAGLAVAPTANADETTLVYVTDSAADTIHVFNGATREMIGVIHGIPKPHGVAFSSDLNRVYVSSEGQSALYIVDQGTGDTFARVRLSGVPNNIAVTNDGQEIVVCIASNPGALDIVSAGSMGRVATIPMPAGMHNVYVTPDGLYAVAGSVAGRFISVVDIKARREVWHLDFDKGVRPMAIEAKPDGKPGRIFVQLSDFNGFAIVDFDSHKEVGRVELPSTPSGHGAGAATPSHGIAIAPDGKSLWVNSAAANALFIYSLPDLKLIGQVALPVLTTANGTRDAEPAWLTFAADGTAYVADTAIDAVSVIDPKAMKEVARVAVGPSPKRMRALVLPYALGTDDDDQALPH